MPECSREGCSQIFENPGKVCDVCNGALYCSNKCYKLNLQRHKKDCKKIMKTREAYKKFPLQELIAGINCEISETICNEDGFECFCKVKNDSHKNGYECIQFNMDNNSMEDIYKSIYQDKSNLFCIMFVNMITAFAGEFNSTFYVMNDLELEDFFIAIGPIKPVDSDLDLNSVKEEDYHSLINLKINGHFYILDMCSSIYDSKSTDCGPVVYQDSNWYKINPHPTYKTPKILVPPMVFRPMAMFNKEFTFIPKLSLRKEQYIEKVIAPLVKTNPELYKEINAHCSRIYLFEINFRLSNYHIENSKK